MTANWPVVRRKSLVLIACGIAVGALSACSRTPPQALLGDPETLLRYSAADMTAASSSAAQVCAVYSQKAQLVGTENQSDGTAVATFKCQ